MRLDELSTPTSISPKALHELGLVAWLKGDATVTRELAIAALNGDANFAAAHTLLGAVERATGAHEAAISALERARSLRPDIATYATNLAAVLVEVGRNDEAIACLRRARQDCPPNVGVLRALGESLIREGAPEEGIDALRAATQVAGADAETWFALGYALQLADAPELAVPAYLAGLRLDPTHVATLQNLGRAYSDLADLETAEEMLIRAGSVRPDLADIWANLAVVRRRQGDLSAAGDLYGKALALEPGNARTRYNLGMTWLLAGDFARGWFAHEARRDISTFPIAMKQTKTPAWDGRPLAGQTLLVHAEQGLGDTLQFVRYLPMIGLLGLADRSRIVLMVQKELVGLLGSVPGISETVLLGAAAPAHDVQVPLLSLPYLLGTTVERIPAAIPYIQPALTDVQHWRGQLGESGPRVGFVWAGNPTHGNDRRRSLKAETALHLARLILDLSPALRLFGLQVGARSRDLESLCVGGRYRSLSPELDSFGATAAVLSMLDLAVCVDTSVAHLAGAMGVPTLVLLPSAPDWRWRTEGSRTPWYPSMHLARCAPPGDAAGAIAEGMEWLGDWISRA